MSPAAQVALLWVAFTGTHYGLATERIERPLSRRLGHWGYLGVYSLVSLATFVPLCIVYFSHRHAGEWFWVLPATGALRVVLYAGLLFAMVLVAASFMRPSPAAILPGDPSPRGVQRLTRHPLMTGFALVGALHLVPNGAASDVAFFGGLTFSSLLLAWHQDRRKLASADPAFRAFYDATPFWLFSGRETLRGLREIPAVAILAALALAVGVRWLHGSIF